MLIANDFLDAIEHLVTICTILGAVGGYLYTRRERQEAGAKAVEQIHKIATNDLPHQNAQLEAQTAILGKQTELLSSMNESLIVIKDRTTRV